MKCPECGFELEPGDEFCINCGAAIDTEPKPVVKKKKMKFHVWPLIVMLVVLGLAAGVIAYVFNLPMITLARAVIGTGLEYKDNETLKTIVAAGKDGSIDVSADLSDVIDDFGIPMLTEIEARAGVKLYMNSEAREVCTNVTGSLGGSNAIDAKLWTKPDEAIIQSDTIIGREAYGVRYGSEEELENAEKLIQQNLYLDLSGYNRYIEMARYFAENSDKIGPWIALKSYCYQFKYGTVSKAKETKTVDGKKENFTTISISFDRQQFLDYVTALEKWCREYKPTAELFSYLEEGEIEEFFSNLDDDYRVDTAYRIGKGHMGTELVLLSQTTNSAGVSAEINYGREISIDSGNDEMHANLVWDTEDGGWHMSYNDEEVASGSLRSADEGRAELVIDDVPVDITILAEDKIPQAPDYSEIKTQEDIEDLGAQIYGNVMGLVMQFAGMPEFQAPVSAAPEIEEPETETEPELWTEPAIETGSAIETEPESEVESETGKESETEIESELESTTEEGKAAESKSEAESKSAAETESETETLAPPEKPVEGTYYYDDGNTFSINFQTGEYQEHVTVAAVIKKDGTYTLTYSNGLFQYEDYGTYTCDKKNHMTFASATGIDATGEYHDKYIEVTIPGYMTGKLDKIK